MFEHLIQAFYDRMIDMEIVHHAGCWVLVCCALLARYSEDLVSRDQNPETLCHNILILRPVSCGADPGQDDEMNDNKDPLKSQDCDWTSRSGREGGTRLFASITHQTTFSLT